MVERAFDLHAYTPCQAIGGIFIRPLNFTVYAERILRGKAETEHKRLFGNIFKVGQ
jgi:hypothetical protein